MGNSQNTPIRIGLLARIGGGPLNAGVIFGLMLITAGTLLFIDNLGILPVDLIDAFWPIILLVFSGAGLYRTRSLAVRIWCVTGLLGAALLILSDFHLIHARADILWPLALIATGIVMLIYRMRWTELTRSFHIGSNSRSGLTDNRLHEAAIFSAVKRRVEAVNFEGGELNSIFGSIEVDLRHANISTTNYTAAIEANSVFGGIEIRIPETWKLSLQGTAVFGNYEDKTIPPRPESGVNSPVLIVSGGTAFGAVTIQN